MHIMNKLLSTQMIVVTAAYFFPLSNIYINFYLFENLVCNSKLCCGLTLLAAKHHTAVCSHFPLRLWDGGENQKIK